MDVSFSGDFIGNSAFSLNGNETMETLGGALNFLHTNGVGTVEGGISPHHRFSDFFFKAVENSEKQHFLSKQSM